MNKAMKLLPAILLAVIIGMIVMIIPAFAEGDDKSDATPSTSASQTIETQDDADASGSNTLGMKALGAGIAIGLAACGGAIGMGSSVGKSVEGISRQPEVEGKIRTTLMLGLVFIETAIIYALLVVILIIFVL
ncbi:MAG TPA: ATP synthase F0 subunit C [Candidatus Faecivivens stercorigallinarum]|nr:ATP synthase F0 subunit C [Candidatus Faecivivens stercorigallinarum]